MLVTAYLPYIFAVNMVLTLVDAAIGYHAAPTLVRYGAADEESLEAAAKTVRGMLALVVALYSFFSCLAYYRQKPLLLIVITVVIVADIMAQIFISRKIRNRGR